MSSKRKKRFEMPYPIQQFLYTIPQWTMSIVILAIISWLTLAPHPLGYMDPPSFPNADKVYHAIMFAVLNYVFLVELCKFYWFEKMPVYIIITGSIITFLAGVILECTQSIMQLGREFEYGDLIANTVGIAIAAVIFGLTQFIFEDM